MYANNEVGNVFPISRMAEMAAEKGVLFHTDAVQAVGKEAIDLGKQPISMLSVRPKLHARPRASACSMCARACASVPSCAAGTRERGRRAGTENVPHIVGLGMAAQLAGQHMQEERTQVARLRDKLEQGLLAAIPDCMVNGDPENRLPNTTNIAFKNVEGEAILLMLDQLGICASSGSACTSGSLEPSHVLRAMGVPFTYAHGSVRLSSPLHHGRRDRLRGREHAPGHQDPARHLALQELTRICGGEGTFPCGKSSLPPLHPSLLQKPLILPQESPPGLQARRAFLRKAHAAPRCL